MIFEPGTLAKSKRGRDKNCIYVIIESNTKYIYLADGVKYTICHTKKKNPKHLQIIKKVRCTLLSDNEGIRKILNEYSCLNKEENCKVSNMQED